MRKSDYFAGHVSNIRGLPKAQLVWKMPEEILVLFHVPLAMGDGLGSQRGQWYCSVAWSKGVEPAPMLFLVGDNPFLS